jgi:flagellar biosynthetic protein FliQ
MTMESILQLTTQALLVTIYVIGPALGAGMVTGLLVAVFQAATQIQESSLSFVPKVVAVGVAIVVSGRWSMSQMLEFFKLVVQQMEGVGQ